ncbi:MAG: hypothetical protein NC240_01385 [Clostridium sp.]|nr:hypothetical protein [Clostridium sp.]
MTRKKKTVIIVAVVMVVIAVSATVLITVTRKKVRGGVEAENTETVMLGKEDLSNVTSEEQEADTNLEGNNHTGTQTTTEKEEEDSQSETKTSTEEAGKPTTESGSTANGNKPTGGTTNNSPPQTTAQSTTQAPSSTTEQSTIQTTTGQPTGGNQGGGNGGNTHQHTWQAQYRTVHHDEEGHYGNVCVKEAYDEPIYEGRYICNYCHQAFGRDEMSHFAICGPPYPPDHPLYGQFETQGSSYSTGQVQVGTTHHEAVYEKKWIVDKKACDEQVLDGYKCTTCGATK